MKIRPEAVMIVLFILIGLSSIGATYDSVITSNNKAVGAVKTNVAILSDICEGNVCEIYLSEIIGSKRYYLQFIIQLRNATKESVFNVHLEGNGGATDTLLYIVSAIKASKGVVNFYVDSDVYSSHAFLALAGNTITIAPYSSFLFHRPAFINPDTREFDLITPEYCDFYSGLDRGISEKEKCLVKLKIDVYNWDKFFNNTVRKYLTNEEYDRYLKGDDIVISGDDMYRRIHNG